MPRKIRNRLCKKCQKIVLDYEREYKKNNSVRIKKYKTEHYKKQKEEGKLPESKKTKRKWEGLERLKKSLNKK